MSQVFAQPSPGDQLRRQAMQALTSGKLPEAIALLEKALEHGPAPDICNELARAYGRSGDPAKAEEYFVKATQLAPADPFFLNSYGVFLLSEARLDDAAPVLERALAVKPGHHEIANNLGLLHHQRGDLKLAEEFFLQAIRSNPSWPGGYGNLGNLMRDLRQNDRAEKAYREALRLAPGNIGGWHALADFLRSIGKYEDAVACLKRIMSQAPFNEKAWLPIVELQETMNKLDDAAETLKDIKARFPNSTAAAIIEGRLLRRQGKTEEAVARLESLGTLAENSLHYIPLQFELGQAYERAGDADKAFACFSRAKSAQAQSPEAAKLDKDQYINTIARIRQEFTPAIAKSITSAPKAANGPAPVFLVGFPRSGTTLLDQILSSHPRIFVAEEEPVMNQLTMHLVRKFGGKQPSGSQTRGGVPDWVLNNPCYPACIADLHDGDIAELREIFFKGHGTEAKAEDGRIFIDKLPLNIRHAAFIHRVFPGAKFILALRHPCDSVLSCFMQQFRLNPAMMPFLDINSSARLYDEVFSLWDLYTQLLPLKAHSIRYEDVVADFRPAVASLLEFLGVEWDDAVLEYDRTAKERNINTPSYHQVTEKIYTRASGRWQRYRKHLQPVMGILEPHAKKHGYSMDPVKE
ncbi:MAG: sulfotransferase family protein [Alphaproteobacteria bacterium]|nr:MAG: sulfotransferase family protein [Alphaproteobacteria bacterium]